MIRAFMPGPTPTPMACPACVWGEREHAEWCDWARLHNLATAALEYSGITFGGSKIYLSPLVGRNEIWMIDRRGEVARVTHLDHIKSS